MGETFPYHYRAFGLRIASEIPVTGFEPSEETGHDVVIRRGNVPENLENVVNRGVLFESNDHEFLVNIDNVGRYYVCNGNEIIIQTKEDTSINVISAFITGASFGALMHQRRLLPLHASTVIYKGKCLMFMGISGTGKSTLASAFLKIGAVFVADDISVIDFSEEIPSVIPAFPTIRIWKDSLAHFGLSHEKLLPVREELEKYYLPVENYRKVNVNVDEIFALSIHNKPYVQLNAVAGIQKFQLIKRHTYFFRGIPKTGLETNHFKLAFELMRNVSVLALYRPVIGFNTDELIRKITNRLGTSYE